jgi:aspartyl-tRNA(Asn)/glutamyl-tRNA(Gln) amidotransferase subunit C
MLDQETVQHIAHLARIGITPEETVRYQKELSSILDFVDELKAQEVPTDQTLATRRFAIPRADQVKDALPEVQAQIIANMPHTTDGSLSVRKVL